MLKKRFALLLIAVLLLSLLASCGNSTEKQSGTEFAKDTSVAATDERVESLDAHGKRQYFGSELIYDYYTFEANDSESVIITGFSSQVAGKTSSDPETMSYVLCREPHTVVVPEKLDGKTVVGIDHSAFRQQDAIRDLVLPKTVESIGDYAFAQCPYLRSVSLPGSVNTLGIAAFYECTDLASLSFAEQGALSVISKSAFMNCSALKTLHVPGYVQTIGNSAFLNCSSLKTVTFEEGLQTIEDLAFCQTAISEPPALPSTLQSIGGWNF